MRTARGGIRVLVSIVALAAGCTGDAPDAPEGLTACHEPRPQMCTREYRPVCGENEDGSQATHPNACEACAQDGVVGHRPGPCAGS